jgi:selenocysteine lyase/cysteine desulfurase
MRIVNRRSFLQTVKALSAGTALSTLTQPAWSHNLQQALATASNRPPHDLASDEDFWLFIQQSYMVSPSIINLNNGGVAPSPIPVQEAMKRNFDQANEAPSYYMWRIMDQGREPLRRNLARLAGCDPEEIAIQRNASEALETVIFGLSLKAGDEVVLSKQDYPNMINAWKQREQRDGIKLVWVDLQLPSENTDELVKSYTRAFTPKTKVLHLTHVINWNGQIMPVRKIADAAYLRHIEVVVDGAHSLAHFQFKVADLGADYFGSSLHKWLSAIGLVHYNVPGFTAADLDAFLWNRYKIHTTNVNWENIKGVRISPNVYTTTKQLDVLAEGINDFVRSRGKNKAIDNKQ